MTDIPDDTLPALDGTDKQTDWAKDIIRDKLWAHAEATKKTLSTQALNGKVDRSELPWPTDCDHHDKKVKHTLEALLEENEVLQQALTHADAGWWIDNRRFSHSNILKMAAEEVA